MDGSEKRVSLRIDLTTGTIELDAPAESFNEAVEKTKDLAATLDLQAKAALPPAAQSAPAAPSHSASEPVQSTARGKTVRSGKSGGRAGRIGSYEPVSGLLSEEQEIELRSFMSEKSPSEQADRVLVAMVKGEQLLGRKALGYNEIYTLMWLAGVKDLPKALDVVLGNMVQHQYVVRDGSGFTVKFVGRNRVESDLPRREV